MKRIQNSRKLISFITVFMMLAAGMLVAIPFGSQNAQAYMTPGSGVFWNFDDLVANSGGAVTGGGGMYQVHETITIQPSDTIFLMGGETVDIDPWLGIAIEVMNGGMFDGGAGMGAMFQSPGPPGSWEGFMVMGGNLMMNGVTIIRAMNGIFADNCIMIDIQNCNIGTCQDAGIRYNFVMGGPMIVNNQIFDNTVGIHTIDSSTQIMGNWIYDNTAGILAQGWAAPSINGNEIYDNRDHGIFLLNFDGGWIGNNGIYANEGAGIYVENSFADIWQNTITGWDAMPGSGMAGGNAIEITGLGPSAWHTTIQQNTLSGGNGDMFNGGPTPNGGHGIYVNNFEGSVVPGPQLVINNNPWIAGGDGGLNILDGGGAGKGGCGIFIDTLADDGDWPGDNHAIKITNNNDIHGGLGGDNIAVMDGFSGDGGHGIVVTDDDAMGSLKVSSNNLILGGKGGDNLATDLGTGMWDVGDGGNAVLVMNCQPGARVEVLGNLDIRGAAAGLGLMSPADNEGGSGVRIEFSGDVKLDDNHGTSEWGLVTVRDSIGTIEITNIDITDSNANNGVLVTAVNSHNLGGRNDNWDFQGKNLLNGVILENTTGFDIENYTAQTSNASALMSYDSDFYLINWSVQSLNAFAAVVNATDHNTATFVRFHAFDSLGGLDLTIGEESRVEVRDSDIGPVVADAVRFKMVDPVPDPADNDTDGVLDFLDNCVDNCTTGVNGTVGDNCDATDFNCENNIFDNCTETGVNITIQGFANNTSINFFHNEYYYCGIASALELNPDLFSNNVEINFEQDEASNCGKGVNVLQDGLTIDNFQLYVTHGVYGPCAARGIGCELKLEGTNLVILDVSGNTIIQQPIGIGIDIDEGNEPRGGELKIDLEGNNFWGNEEGVAILGGGGTPYPDVSLKQNNDEIIIHQNVFKNNQIGFDTSKITFTGLESVNQIAPFGAGGPQPMSNGLNVSSFQIVNNKFENNTDCGIILQNDHNFEISGNLIANNTNYGICLVDCTGGIIYHNNIIDNVWRQAFDNGDNQWDAGYPAGGNYWSDYAGIDINNGPDQDILGSDGIGDTPYEDIHYGAYMGWANSSAFPNYAPSGMPDFDQRQAPWMTLNAGVNGAMDSPPVGDDFLVNPTPGPFMICIAPGPNHILDTPPAGDDTMEFAYCGPAAAANALWWLDSKFADHSGVPGDGNDTHNLVKDLGAGDDHDSANPPLLLTTMATYFQTEMFGDTNPNRMTVGLDQYLVDRGEDANYTISETAWPIFEQVGKEQQNNSALIMFLGFYDSDGNRIYGHIVTVAGVEMGGFLLSLSDPINNIANPIADLFAYNNATNVSHDVYNALPGAPHPSLPPNCFWLPGYMSAYGIPIPPGSFAACEHMVAIKHNYTPKDRYPLIAPYEYAEFNITLQLGWNLISLPLRQFDWAPGAVLDSINGSWDCIQTYDAATDTWLSTNLHRPDSLNDLDVMNHFNAYWIHITMPTVLTVRGDRFGSPIGIPLNAGHMYLIGYPSLVPQTVAAALVGTGYIPPVEAFNASAPYRISPIGPGDFMEPGKGYWVRVPADTVWMVSW
jgi:parallel beta-helix repeat protein